MEWSLAHLWLILALILGVAELASGVLVLLALGIAAALTAVLAFAGFSFEWQLAGMGLLSGILVPVAIIWIKPRFSPKGVSYGTTGTGIERGSVYRTIKRDFNGATGVKVNGAGHQPDCCRNRYFHHCQGPGNRTPVRGYGY